MSHVPFPYTLISCPCSEVSPAEDDPQRPSEILHPTEQNDEEHEEKQFDPRHPRSNFSLFPLEHLLYCEDCCQIKCPRCILEETIGYYCPHCLFEVPRKDVRDEGNRCPRNCFNCPLCTSHLSLIPTYENKEESSEAPYIHKCEYCMWTSLDCGLKYQNKLDLRRELDRFSKKADRRPALDELSQGLSRSKLSQKPLSPDPDSNKNEKSPVDTPQDDQIDDPLARFHALKNFYQSQLKNTTETDDPYSPFGTPRSHLSRLASIYNIPLKKSQTQQPQPMREALFPSEGLFIPPSSPTKAITSLAHPDAYHTTTSLRQYHYQHGGSASGSLTARTTSSLLPMPTTLHATRSKRCAECKHILVKYEYKPDTTRYRIRLVAVSYIPIVTLRPLVPPAAPTPTSPTTAMIDPTQTLPVSKPTQYLLTLRNHLFDRLRVRLGTPSTTPGPRPHRVTILCPQFEVGANSEVWDAAAAADAAATTTTVSVSSSSAVTGGGGGASQVFESGKEVVAGKVYESGRNWTSVVVEIVAVAAATATATATAGRDGQSGEGEGGGKEDEDEDEDVLEVPIRVSLEWKVTDEEALKQRRAVVDEDDRGERELNYWMVLGVGRVVG